MARSECSNCGCAMYNRKCTNCHEAHFIEEQYMELDMPVPKLIQDEAVEARRKAKIQQKVEDEERGR